MRWRLLGAAAGVFLLLATACTPKADPYTTPPTIHFGVDLCARSGMIISDPTYAAAYTTPSGETRAFDDIGEMILYYREHDEGVAALWVHDRQTGDWIRAEQASYVLSPYLQTPMGFGLAALRSAEEARAEAAHLTGTQLSFNELLAYPYLREGLGTHVHGDH